MKLKGWIGRRWVVDGLLAIAVAAVQLGHAAVSAGGGPTPWRQLDGLAYGLLVAGPLALVVRRRWPLAVLAATVTVTVAYAARGYREGPSSLAVYPALYTVATSVAWRQTVPAALATVVAVAGGEFAFYGDTMFAREPLYVAVSLLAFVWLGEAVRARRAYVAELRGRAELAEHTREEEALRRVDEERLRIARELHDVVSHSIGVISVQAGVAAHLLQRRPDKAGQALAVIRQASDEALGELHAMLGVLRQPGDGRAPLAPTPGLAQLDALVGKAVATGLRVDVTVKGEPRPLPPAVDLACYRIVQESLTNVVRHAGASSATVGIAHAGGEVVVDVLDDGCGGAADGGVGAGRGIAGMRERARTLGGTLAAGPCPEGGFRVRARLPAGGAAG
jgi:signal transduction histidine kinase